MPFLLVDRVIGNFEANGIIGLAPGDDEKNYIHQLYAQGVVEELKVGLNFENPADFDSQSKIAFGGWDYSQIYGGEDGLNYYPNGASEYWGVRIGDVSYDS